MRNKTLLVGAILVAWLVTGCDGCGDPRSACDCETDRNIGGYAQLGPNNQTAVLSTYDHDNGFAADASCHTEMRLSFWWVDSARAVTTEMPCLNYSFETVFGYFPVGEQNISMKRDLTAPYYYRWTIKINEAADRTDPEAILYKIMATYNPDCSIPGEIYVSMDIYYKLYDEAQHERDEDEECA
jgi:hypothetical protein